MAYHVKRTAAEVRASTLKGMASGGVIIHTPSYASWDIAGRCERRPVIEQQGRGHTRLIAGRAMYEASRTLSLAVRCRKCPECLRDRRTRWSRRAVVEYKQAPRSWFGTLTFRPEIRYRLLALTRQRLDAQFCDLAGLKPQQQFAEIHRTSGPLVTNYVKTLRMGDRKKDGLLLPFRYLLVVEPHKDWFPHYHLLVHESNEFQPVRKEALDRAWQQHGFCRWRVVKDSRAASYTAKYLGKFSMARVRASRNYGLDRQASSIGQNDRVSPF